MSWITGRVQLYESLEPTHVQVGAPLYYTRRDGKSYSTETGKEVKVVDYTDKFRSLLKECIKEKNK